MEMIHMVKGLKSVYQWFATLRRRIFLKLILMIAIPNLLLIVVITQLMSAQINNKINEMNDTLFVLEHAASREIRAIFNDVTTLTNQILIEPDVQHVLLSGWQSKMGNEVKEITDDRMMLEEKYSNQNVMRDILSRSRLIWNNIFSLAVLDVNGEIYLNTSENYQIYPEDIKNSELIKFASSPDQYGLAWSVSDVLTKNNDMITIIRKIYGVNQPRDVIGYVIVNLSLNAVRDSFETYNYYDQMIFGMMSASENAWMVYDYKKIQGGVGKLIQNDPEEIDSKLTDVVLNDRTWRMVLKQSNQDYLFVGLDNEFIRKQTEEIRKNLVYGYILFLLIALIVSIRGTKTLSTRLGMLIRGMRKFGQEKWGTRIQLKGNDEIRLIGDQFNVMATQIERLMIDLTEEQRLKQLFELRVLEYQINPHFLYNTLDSIHWLAQENDQSQISEMVGGLSKLFRMILSKGREIITLAEEFEMVRIYVLIQKIRFDERFDFTLSISEEVATLPISKLVMQPLVENAIIHGIRRLRIKGQLRISGYLELDEVVVEIFDNGVGMTEEQLMEQINLLNSEVLAQGIIASTGYGMKNVDSRLKLLYGDNYRMIIQSSRDSGTGTRVQIRIKEKAMKQKQAEIPQS
jgi:two-component system sensor histidine kinase YesM